MQMERVGQGKSETTLCGLDGLKATDTPVAFSVFLARRDSGDSVADAEILWTMPLDTENISLSHRVRRAFPSLAQRGLIVADISDAGVYFMCRHLGSFIRAKQVNRRTFRIGSV
jgi:hypothetical protein